MNFESLLKEIAVEAKIDAKDSEKERGKLHNFVSPTPLTMLTAVNLYKMSLRLGSVNNWLYFMLN